MALSYRVCDARSTVATAVTAIIEDGDGGVVKRIALGTRSTGVWQRLHWTPRAAGVYRFTVTARDQAGNRETVSRSSTVLVEWPARLTIGRSVQGRRITVARFGSGGRRLLVVGGVHPNETGVPVAKEFIAYLTAHPNVVPAGWRIDVIACLSPDGLARGSRGNADDVDLNRNFPSSSWRRALRSGDPSRSCGLSGGRYAGSEPETKALIAYLRQGFAAEFSLHCDAGILDCHGHGGTTLGKRMAALCALPIGRLSYESRMTGTLEQYVAQVYRIPAITVELRDAELRSGLRRALLAACRP
jgi:predicted deacylase